MAQGVRRRVGAAGGGEARTVLILVIQGSPLPTVRIAYTDGETEGPESSSVHCARWRCTCGSLRISAICFDVPVLYR
jgi:hypothetical protein